MTDQIKPRFGYWNIRHLSSALRYQLAYQKIDYEMVTYQEGPEPDYSREEWTSQK